ncbi:MAG: purine-nucleoside phosphorylase [Sarcina sp.]
MSIHIEAKQGQIADTVLLPGDPLRAKFIAETFLENAECYNNVRGMLGYTGTYKGKKISVQGTGMGIPSISIYATELIKDYGVKNLIRIGTAGAINTDVKLRDLVIGVSAHTDSATTAHIFKGAHFAPTASFKLASLAHKNAVKLGLEPRMESLFTSDSFYNHYLENYEMWAKVGTTAVEMEAAGLYTVAALYGANALAIVTISDHIITGEVTSPEERQLTFKDMMKVALETALEL